jgi:hypothetical protein
VQFIPGLFVIDATLTSAATSVTRNSEASASGYGASALQNINVTWPVATSSSDRSHKVVLELTGGLLCCVNYAAVTLSDNQSNTYTLLWANAQKRMAVYQAPSQGASSLVLSLNNLVNPYPYQESLYSNSNMYSYRLTVLKDYQQQLVQAGSQPAYSTYQINSTGAVALASMGLYRLTPGFSVLPQWPHFQEFTLSVSPATYPARRITRAVVTFTSGVAALKSCRISGTANPSPRMPCAIAKSGSQWTLSVSGLYDSTSASAVTLLVRMTVSAGSLGYQLDTYQEEGKLEFQSTGSLAVSSYSTSRAHDSTMALYSQKYYEEHYELGLRELVPAAGLTARAMDLQFTNPFAMVFGDTFKVEMPGTAFLKGKSTPTSVFCLFLPAVQYNTNFGMAVYSTCAYDSATGIYSLVLPLTALATNTLTVLRILEIKDERS